MVSIPTPPVDKSHRAQACALVEAARGYEGTKEKQEESSMPHHNKNLHMVEQTNERTTPA